ncbi:MAG: isoprenylcysteine carboxylmethyltransferase family protein [Anaerolineae bacterium]|jgi:protein-S-isoprenylcysteine O-methyltransferase Ste14|nr:isoprenylcysteine carboxylmethyltransferase family protein [Anaerolineae bacterium]
MHSTDTAKLPRVRLNRYGYNCIARHLFTALLVSLPLFIGAGTWDYTAGWLISSLTLAGWVVLSLVLAVTSPALLNQRGQRASAMPGTRRWDWIILGLYSLLLLLTPLLAGLDYRAGQAAAGPLPTVAGVALLVAHFALLTWSMSANRFFEATVRLQNGQQVVQSGPYRYVRHPGYSAVILGFLAVPLAAGSLLAGLPALAGVLVFTVRTALEDATLRRELPGYAAYAGHTRYRLLPGVW